MSIREAMEKNRNVTIGIAAVIIGVAVVAIGYQLFSDGDSYDEPSNEFFTVDDGANYLVGDINQVPPFQLEGKTAVKAYVFECGGKKFVGYIERFTPEAQKIIQASKNSANQLKPDGTPAEWVIQLPFAQSTGREVKRPGDKEWVSAIGPQGLQLMQITCPNGESGPPTPVVPGL